MSPPVHHHHHHHPPSSTVTVGSPSVSMQPRTVSYPVGQRQCVYGTEYRRLAPFAQRPIADRDDRLCERLEATVPEQQHDTNAFTATRPIGVAFEMDVPPIACPPGRTRRTADKPAGGNGNGNGGNGNGGNGSGNNGSGNGNGSGSRRPAAATGSKPQQSAPARPLPYPTPTPVPYTAIVFGGNEIPALCDSCTALDCLCAEFRAGRHT